MTSVPAHFFSCDWGTTSFRLRLVSRAEGRVVAEMADDNGARAIASSLPDNAGAADRAAAFGSALKRALACLPQAADPLAAGVPVVISGMASSSIGWRELPYAGLPFPVDGSQTVGEWLEVPWSSRSVPVLLVSGLAGEMEIMRGEETQVIGLLAQPRFCELAEQVTVILPGTHSKHVHVSTGSVTTLQTYMTGELFDVLSTHSILRFTAGGLAEERDGPAFDDGVTATCDRGLMRSLFQTRTRSVLGGQPVPANRAFLSGLMIGSELVEIADEHPDSPLLLAGGGIVESYTRAAHVLGLRDRLVVATRAEFDNAVTRGHELLLQRFGVIPS